MGKLHFYIIFFSCVLIRNNTVFSQLSTSTTKNSIIVHLDSTKTKSLSYSNSFAKSYHVLYSNKNFVIIQRKYRLDKGQINDYVFIEWRSDERISRVVEFENIIIDSLFSNIVILDDFIFIECGAHSQSYLIDYLFINLEECMKCFRLKN